MSEIHVRRWAAAIFLVMALIVGGVIGTLATAKTQHTVPMFVNTKSFGGGGSVSFENGFTPVVEKVLPAVVNISSTKVVKVPGGNPNPFLDDPFFRQFFGRNFGNTPRGPQQEREHSLGSGVIVSADGYILTNNHVVEGANDISVALPDRRVFKGRVVGADAKTDIAVVKIDQANLPVMAMGDSGKVRTGQFVLAVGDPFGIGETVTMGIVSATGRGGLGIENYEDFIQTDAAINPGNSGGAMVDVNGLLVGINTAILTGGGGGNQGVGFAIPVNMARNVMQQIIKSGKVTRGWLGVSIQPVTPDLAQAFGLNKDQGALVAEVEPNSPASGAGLQKGDIVLSLNNQTVVDARALSLAVSQMAPGSTVHLTIFRNGKQQDVTATLGEMPAEKTQANNQGGGSSNALQGLSVDNLTPNVLQQLNLPSNTQGVVVTDVADGSPAADAGLQQGDIIQEVNRQPVRNVSDFQNALRQAGNKPILLLVNHGGQTGYVVIQTH
jgi:serine protease Do